MKPGFGWTKMTDLCQCFFIFGTLSRESPNRECHVSISLGPWAAEPLCGREGWRRRTCSTDLSALIIVIKNTTSIQRTQNTRWHQIQKHLAQNTNADKNRNTARIAEAVLRRFNVSYLSNRSCSVFVCIKPCPMGIGPKYARSSLKANSSPMSSIKKILKCQTEL